LVVSWPEYKVTPRIVTLAGYVDVTVTGLPCTHVLETVTVRPLESNAVVAPTDVAERTVDVIVEVRPGSATPAIVDARRAPSLVAALTSWNCM